MEEVIRGEINIQGIGSATIPQPPPPIDITQAMFIKAVWRNGISTSLCLGTETPWNDLEKYEQHTLTSTNDIKPKQSQRHNV